MPAKPNNGGIHVKGNVSGIIVYGDDNQVTAGEAGASAPAESRSPHQRNSAEDHGKLFAVTHGTMNVTVKRSGEPGNEEGENGESK